MFRYTICQNLDCPNFVPIGNSFPKRTLFSVTIQSHIHATSQREKSSTKLSSVDNFDFFGNFSIFSAAFFKGGVISEDIFEMVPSSKIFSNFSSMFLNPNIFFQFEFEFIRYEKPPEIN